jgi:DNA repair exonuclease SbcCD ATPase subunit
MAEHYPDDEEVLCTEHPENPKKYSECMQEEVRALTERLERFEAPRPKCNKGHENALPLKLWDCPMCTEEIRAERDKLAARAAELDKAISGGHVARDIIRSLWDEDLRRERDRLAAEVERLRKEIEKLVGALGTLVRKLRTVEADPQFQAVWALSHFHGHPYAGPRYDKELEAAEAALTET